MLPESSFNLAPTAVDIHRSSFDIQHRHLTTFSAGKLYPIFNFHVLPGDTVSLDFAFLSRMLTPIHPVMDSAYIDFTFFFVPYRLCWEHWKEFMGESPLDPYINPNEYSVPKLTPPEDEGFIASKTVADYMGIPAGTTPPAFSALDFRAFGLTWNNWYRDQNLQSGIDVPLGDADEAYTTDVTILNNGFYSDDYITECCRGGALPPVNKFHDYFTSALKEPQKGDPVPIPLNGFAPLVFINGIEQPADYYNTLPVNGVNLGQPIFYDFNSDGAVDGQRILYSDNGKLAYGQDDSQSEPIYDGATIANGFINLGGQPDPRLPASAQVYSTINDLRFAFAMQRLLENDNRGGTRYREVLRSHFGVLSPDATQQIPEYLYGCRTRVGMQQVVQTSSTDSVSPQGNTAAYSLSSDNRSAFTKSFTEHGVILGCCCLRAQHTYQQGVSPHFFKFDRTDFYFPELANIGEQPIFNKFLYSPRDVADIDESDKIFGFQEAWAEYRMKPNIISGEMRSGFNTSLDSWHYGDYYSSMPYLSDTWIREPRSNIDRTLAVTGTEEEPIDQMLLDISFDIKAVRPLPVYSIPGMGAHL